MVGQLLTDDWQLELRGLLMGPDSPLEVTRLSGLDIPDVRVRDRRRPGRHGAWLGRDYKRERRITARIEIADEDDQTRWALKRTLSQAWDTSEQDVDLAIRLAGDVYLARGRPRRCTWTDEAPNQLLFADVQFVAGDHRLYSAGLQQRQLTVAEVDGGFTFPLTFPLTFGTPGATGITQIVNDGNAAADPTVRLNGPLTSPRLEHLGRAQTVALAGDIPAGQHVDIDFDARTVLLGGTSSRYDWFHGQWWQLDPGPNEIRFLAAAGDGTAQLTYRHAYTTPGPALLSPLANQEPNDE